MKSKSYRILLVIVALLISITAVGCQGSSESATSTENGGLRTPVPQPDELAGSIKFSTYSTEGYDASAFNFIGDFNQQYPGVEISEDSAISYEEYFATLDQRVEDGTIGDVFLVDSDRLATYVEKGYVLDITPYLDGLIEYTSGSYSKLVPEELFFGAAYQSALYQDKMYMIPTEYENKAVWVNLDLLQEAGLTVPEDKWTWDDLLSYAEALKKIGCKNPISMDYADFSIWGSFAMSQGMDILMEGATPEDKVLNLTDAKVAQGLEYLVDSFIRTGYVAEKTPDQITPEELSEYGMVVISHADLSKWEKKLAEEGFEWEFAHLPRFEGKDGATNVRIGVKTLGLAVRVRDLSQEEEENAQAMRDEICAQLALYAMVHEAATHLSGLSGVRVPALISVNHARFWRDYPVSGKNTSVFSLFSEYDYAANLSVYMSLDAAKEIDAAMGKALKDCASAGAGTHVDAYLQTIQDLANTKW